MEYYKTILTDNNNIEYYYYPKYNLLLPKEIDLSNSSYSEKIAFFLSKLQPKTVSDNRLKEGIRRRIGSVRKIVLELSQDCNLKCRYCVYSGRFISERKHSKKYMNIKMAKLSIDYFLNWIEKNKRINYNPEFFTVGYYGGEPLKNYEVLKESLIYARKRFSNERGNSAILNFDMTTNGLLLDKEKIDFLASNNVRIVISLDGPLEIQNKNRGKGTYEILFDKLLYIYENYPEYYKKHVDYSIVYVPDTDMKQIREYFSKEIFESCSRLNLGHVKTIYSSLKYPENGKNEKEVTIEIREKMNHGEKLTKIEQQIWKYHFGFGLNSLTIRDKGGYGAFCILGEKSIYITVDGEFQACEKIGQGFGIGSLVKGFNFKRIEELERERIRLTQKCKNCLIQSICVACTAFVGFNGKIVLEEYCKQAISDFKRRVSDYLEYQKS